MHSVLLLSLFSLVFAGKGKLGFSLGVKRADGSCKTTPDYTADFAAIKQYASIVRIYSTSDCNAMQNIMPAAVASGTKVILGVWPNDDNHFALETATLSQFLPLYYHNVHAIAVGSEALYRKDLTPAALASKIQEVRKLVRSMSLNLPIGTADVIKNHS